MPRLPHRYPPISAPALLAAALLAVTLLAGCSGNAAVTAPATPPATAVLAPTKGSSSASAGAATAAAAATAGGTSPSGTTPATPAPAAHLAGNADLRTLLPPVLGGRRMTMTQFNGSDFVASPNSLSQQMVDLLRSLGRGPADLTMAVASESASASDPSITAFRVQGVQADVFLNRYLPFVKSSIPSTQISQVPLAGKEVWLVTAPAPTPPSYHVPRDDVLFVVLASDANVALEAIGALP